jgi:hypothetical protein
MPTTSAIIGYIASGLVLTTFCTNDLRRLRTLAILSNIVFISYGALAGLPPVLGLHLLLLPINAIRLMRMSNTAPSADDCKLLPSKLAMRIGFDAAPSKATGSSCHRRDQRMAIGAGRLVRRHGYARARCGTAIKPETLGRGPVAASVATSVGLERARTSGSRQPSGALQRNWGDFGGWTC